jgi:hypothetical protein
VNKGNINLAASSRAKLIAINPSIAETDLMKQPGHIKPIGLFLILFCSAIALGIFILMFPQAWKATKAKIAIRKQSHQLPCRKCRFFTNNSYLCCTVNPFIVLTEQAIDCPDYYP